MLSIQFSAEMPTVRKCTAAQVCAKSKSTVSEFPVAPSKLDTRIESTYEALQMVSVEIRNDFMLSPRLGSISVFSEVFS